MVFAIPTPRTEAAEGGDERPPGPTRFSTHTHKHRHSIHTTEPRSTAAAAATTTTTFPHRSRLAPPVSGVFEGSGSGEPSGDDQAEEEEQEEPDEEAGSGIPKESSGADDPVGKSLLFHFIAMMP